MKLERIRASVLHLLETIEVPLHRAIEEAVAVVEPALHNVHSNCFSHLEGQEQMSVP